MPTYEYLCGSCTRRIDVLHGIHAQGPTICEGCGGPLRKAISAAAVVFKGSGWAKKDAARAAARPASDQSESGPSSSDGVPTDGSPSDRSSSDPEHPKEATPPRGSDTETDRAGTPASRGGTPTKPGPKDRPTPATPGRSGRVAEKGSNPSHRAD